LPRNGHRPRRNDSLSSLGGYLSRYAQEFLESTSIRCRLEVADSDSHYPCDSEQRHQLFLAFKEALTNIVRHSGATEVSIRIALDGEKLLVVSIEDNGRGLPRMPTEAGDGLLNLHQRMARLAGHCDIANRAEGGVTVRLSMPLSKNSSTAS
jgi:signal transduction histidine kinase